MTVTNASFLPEGSSTEWREGNFHLYVPDGSGYFEITFWGVGEDFELASEGEAILPRLQALQTIAKERIHEAPWLAHLDEKGCGTLNPGRVQLEPDAEANLVEIRKALLFGKKSVEAPPPAMEVADVPKSHLFFRQCDRAAVAVHERFPDLFSARTHITSLFHKGERHYADLEPGAWDRAQKVREDFAPVIQRLFKNPKSQDTTDQRVKEWLLAIAKEVASQVTAPDDLQKFRFDILWKIAIFFLPDTTGHTKFCNELLSMWKK